MVTLSELKLFLGIPDADTSSDAWLQSQIDLLEACIEGYTGRKFAVTNYTQKFLANSNTLYTYHYPIVTMDKIYICDSLVEGETATSEEISAACLWDSNSGRINSPKVYLRNKNMVLKYSAGFSSTPAPIKNVIFNLVEERWNKKQAGMNLNFGTDVQRINIPGTISIDFDYTLNGNDRKNHFGVFLGQYANVLDAYRTERVLVGAISEEMYVSES